MTRPPSLAPDSIPRRGFLARALALLGGGALLARPERARAGTLPAEFLGEIRIFSGGFAPGGWAFCNGQLLPIAPFTALFSLLGTYYGGDGQTTFALPDLRGRVPIHRGDGPGLAPHWLGEKGGAELHVVTMAQMPLHTHAMQVSTAAGTVATPGASVVPARNAAGIPSWSSSADGFMAPNAVSSVGSGQAHNNVQPFLAVSFIIALQGPYPSTM